MQHLALYMTGYGVDCQAYKERISTPIVQSEDEDTSQAPRQRHILGRVDELFDDDPGGNEMNQSQKGLAQFLISCRNTAKLLEVIEKPFHLLA